MPGFNITDVYTEMSRPVNKALLTALMLTIALAAFIAGSWSAQRCEVYEQPTRLAARLHHDRVLFPRQNQSQDQKSKVTSSIHAGDRSAPSDDEKWPVVEIPMATNFEPAFPENREAASQKGTSQLATMRAEVAFMRRKVRTLRLEYGITHCALKGIGPNGGFCVSKAAANNGSAPVSGTLLDGSLCTALGRMMTGQAVADLGAGRGHYGKCLEPFVRKYVPYDGGEGIEEVTHGFVQFLDLSEPTWLGVSFDWVVSLEVGEHIPAEKEAVFIGNVLRHARRGVVLSWAVPGQGGHFHVNEQPNDYVVKRVKELGGGSFEYNEAMSEALRAASSFWWFKNTLMVFDRV